MSRFYSHLNTAATVVASYNGSAALSVFLKDFFSKQKKYGSRDRRTIASLCYNFYRTGYALMHKTPEDRLLAGLFLCSNFYNEILQNKKPEWNEKITLLLDEKISISGIDVKTIFPFTDKLLFNIDIDLFNTSFLIQPKLFIRLRPGKKETLKQKLETANIDFEEIDSACFAFSNATKLDEVADINRDAVIQDLNSQRTGELITAGNLHASINIWDCCAASGGKSILAHDIFPKGTLTVSDIRQSIIQNLHKRFKEAAIENYSSFIADLTDYKGLQSALKNERFELIICDAPCSGSGTWSRTPEQLLFFQQTEIEKYSNLQKRICINTIPFLKKHGYFLYITCSVFKEENEDIVEFIQQQTALTLVKTELLKGYEIKADTMFAALFRFG